MLTRTPGLLGVFGGPGAVPSVKIPVSLSGEIAYPRQHHGTVFRPQGGGRTMGRSPVGRVFMGGRRGKSGRCRVRPHTGGRAYAVMCDNEMRQGASDPLGADPVAPVKIIL